MRVLVVGSGGREHALVWKLSQATSISALFCAPGNGGISTIARCIDVEATDTNGLVAFAKREGIELVVVGPENALAVGVVDAFDRIGIPAFGPCRRGSQIETSKVFAKHLMKDYGIPTAPFRIFDDYGEAHDYLQTLNPPYVIKADGLCAGKGAYVIKNADEGETALKELLVDKVYGDAGKRVVVEGFLRGVEASYLAFSDGSTIVPMVASQDHKALLNGDEGPNTGGMGAYTPIPFIDRKTGTNIDRRIIMQTVSALRKEGVVYKGVLYAGLMMEANDPYVLEFNARFGDPETQPILFKMESDLLPILSACVQGTLKDVQKMEWRKGVSLCVVIASRGYPGRPEKGHLIEGLEELEGRKDVVVFHSGTKKIGNRYYTSGGRVLGVTVLGENYEDAIKKAYDAVSCVRFEGMYYRTDIGGKAVGVPAPEEGKTK
jgi:phosphoribosylamine---glycine ligase